jgi:hypothetical protein
VLRFEISLTIINNIGGCMENIKMYPGDNPISELVSDDIYDLLDTRGLIDHKSLRDYKIRSKFKNLRASKFSAGDAIDLIREEYPYLQFDTIRKIVYASRKD